VELAAQARRLSVRVAVAARMWKAVDVRSRARWRSYRYRSHGRESPRRDARLLKTAGQAMVGDSQLALQDLVNHGEG
jgi:hypothetical protein